MQKPASSRHTNAYTPPEAPSHPDRGFAIALDVGAAVVEIDVDAPGTVALTATIGQNDFFALFGGGAVTPWCAETSVLVQGELHVQAGDGLEVRGPVLVAQHKGCVAVVRVIEPESVHCALLFAPSPDEMYRGAFLTSGASGTAQLQSFLAAMSSAAVAAMQPGAAH